jgi:hypothetical protein
LIAEPTVHEDFDDDCNFEGQNGKEFAAQWDHLAKIEQNNMQQDLNR